jgi:hypothetical protein
VAEALQAQRALDCVANRIPLRMHANDLNDTPSKSAARLAAEALFEQRRPATAPTDPSVPVVKVISRRRLPAPDEPGAAGTATEGGADSAAPARKTPRVFVLRPAAPAPSAPAAESQSLVPAVPVRRRRTRAAPVTVIYSAPPAPAADTAAAALDDAELPSSTRLASALAAVDPILAEIARGPVLQLVVADAADVEVARLGVRQVEAADAGRRRHRQAVGQAHADVAGLQHAEHRALDAVVGAGRVARRGADAAVGFSAISCSWQLLVGA